MKKLCITLLLSILFLSYPFYVTATVYKIDDYEYYEESYVTDISSGTYNGAAITTDEQVFTWGKGESGVLGNGTTNSSGSPQNITHYFNLAVDETVEQVSVGYATMFAYTSENRIFAWGDNSGELYGIGTTTSSYTPQDITSYFTFNVDENVIDIAVGIDSVFVLTDEGRIFAWGSNTAGQLANGQSSFDSTITEQTDHFTLSGSEVIVDIQAGTRSYMAITDEGRLYAWGNNLYGELGTADTGKKTLATETTGNFGLSVGETITAFAIGDTHGVVATSEGDVYTFGSNVYGQIGDGTSINRIGPTNIASSMSLNPNEYVTAIDAYRHNILVTNEGKIFGWGYNSRHLVSTSNDTYIRTPQNITSGFNLDALELPTIPAVTIYASYIVTDLNSFYSWGFNEEGLLVVGNITKQETGVPIEQYGTFDTVIIEPFLYSDVTMIESFQSHVMAYTESDRLYVWGNNLYGNCGDGTTTRITSPKDITDSLNLYGYETIIELEAADHHSMILTSEGRVFGWGQNGTGQLGLGDTVDRHSPVEITPFIPLNVGEEVHHIYLGGATTFVTTTDARILATGNNYYGQLGIGNKTNQYSFIDITANFNLAVGEIISKVANGGKHTVVLTNQSNIYTMGENSQGALGNNSTLDHYSPLLINSFFTLNVGENIVDIQAGEEHTVFLTSEGRVFSWGDNAQGTVGDGTQTDKLVPTDITIQFDTDVGQPIDSIQVGQYHNFAISTNGKVFSWGDNGYAQLGDNTTTDRLAPTEVTSHMETGTDTLSFIETGGSTTFLVTNEGSLYAFGRNNYNEVGTVDGTLQVYPTEKVSIDEFIGKIHFSYVDEQTLTSADHVEIDIYFEKDIENILLGVSINSTLYTGSDLVFDVGKVTVLVDNTYSLNDVVTFEIDSIRTVDITDHNTMGPLEVTTTFVEDTAAPTFDVSDQLIEIGSGFTGDLMPFILNLTDDFDDDIQVDFTGTVDYERIGVYPIIVTAVDDSTNETQKTFYVEMVDTQAPTISWNTTTSFEAGSTLQLEEYITITDNQIYGGFTVSYDEEIQIDTVNSYEITYYVTDYAGNQETETFTIQIIDTTPPTFDEIETQIFEAGDYTSYDWTSLITNIVENTSSGTVKNVIHDTTIFDVPGLYYVTVSVEDAYANDTERSFSVVIIDTTPPQFNDIEDVTLEAGSDPIDFTTYITTYTDNANTPYTVFVEEDNVVYNTADTYIVTVGVRDEDGNEGTSSFTVTIVDTTGPQINLNGDSIIYLDLGEPYVEHGVTIIDNATGPLVPLISDPPDTNVPGTYYITYNVTDQAGNPAQEVTRTVIVSEDVNLFAVLNKGIDSIGINQEHIDSGVTVFSYLAYTIETTSTLDITTAGTYKITYTITDIMDHTITVIRHVTVYEKAPIVTFYFGNTVTSLQLGETYTDSSCTVKIDNDMFQCNQKENTINYDVTGIYTITYAYTYNGIEYTYDKYIFIYNANSVLTLYYDSNKKEGDLV